MSDRLIALFSEGLGVPIDQLSDATSPENTPAWDSLAAVTLVSLIESTYAVTLKSRDIMRMRTIGLARSSLVDKGIDPS